MDMHLFHPTAGTKRNYKAMDRMNSRTGRLYCHFYEWIGWYNMSVPKRLLGHYRLFQLYKAGSPQLEAGMPPARGYILQCRGSNSLKYFLNRCFTITNSILTRGGTDRSIEVHGVNRMLLFGRATILQDFLDSADIDFNQAFHNAMQQISDPAFINTTFPISNSMLVQVNNDHRQLIQNTGEFHVHQTISEKPTESPGTKGKEKGVFSKKQILLLFDLLSQLTKIERIDLDKPNKFEKIAALLQALTGKGRDSWLAELKDYKGKNLYEYHSRGELDELLRILTNLSETFKTAGLRSVSDIADKKIRELTVKGRSLQ